MPYHRIIDTARDCTQGIGTTGRGIGPAYEDKARRLGIRVVDLANETYLKKKLDAAFEEKQEYITRILKLKPLDKDSIFKKLSAMGARIRPYVRDVPVLLDENMKQGRHLLFEGAQGANLDMDHGTYPYVTSSNTVAGQACVGSGIGPTAIHSVIGICKAYTTRVGVAPSRPNSATRQAKGSVPSAANTGPPPADPGAAAGWTWWRCGTPYA